MYACMHVYIPCVSVLLSEVEEVFRGPRTGEVGL